MSQGRPHTSESETHSESGLITSLLQKLTTSVCRQPGGTLWIVALITIFSLGITARFLSFKTDRSDLIDSNSAFHQRWLSYTEKFGDKAEVVVVVEAEDTSTIEATLDDIGQRLEAEPQFFDRVMYRFASGSLREKALQFLSPKELEAANSRLEMYSPILEGHWNRAGLESYCLRLTNYIQESEALSHKKDLQGAIHQASKLTESLSQFIANPQNMTSPWPEIVSGSSIPQGASFETRYQISASGKMGFLLFVPVQVEADFSGTSSSLNRLKKILKDVQTDRQSVTLGITGIPVLEADEMERSQADMMKASIISFIGVGLILLIGFRGFRHPILALMMLGVGLAWTLGYTTIAVGHLNILSVSFAAILIGLGIDFAIHYLARYLELRHHGEDLQPALVKTSMSIGTGIVTAAVTTSLAFLCATFTSFLGVAELGIIAGGGILICGAVTFFVLPALVTLADRKLEPRQLPTPFQGNFLRKITSEAPVLVAGITLFAIIVIGLQGFTFRNGELKSIVEYDSNLLNLQAKGLKSVELQNKIFQESNGSLLYAISLTDSAEQARLLKEKYLELPSVGRVEELGSYMPNYPAQETNLLVQAIHSRLSRISDLPRELPQLDPSSIGQALDNLYQQLKKQNSELPQKTALQLDTTLNILSEMELKSQLELLSAYQQGMLISLHRQFKMMSVVANPVPVSPNDFPTAVRSRFVSTGGDWQVRIYPRVQIWDEAPLTEFVNDVRSVDPEVTGTPLQNYEAARQIRESYFDAALYALAVICLVLLIDSLPIWPLVLTLLAPLSVIAFTVFTIQRSGVPINPFLLVFIYVGLAVVIAWIFDASSVTNTFLSLMPPLAGSFMMFGILGICGIHLNPANLIVLPLILGIGVDDGVHVIHDFRSQSSRYSTSPSTINAVTLTSLTSMVGFGSMLVAAHQGLVSLGIVLVVGVGSCLFVSLVTLPALLTLMDDWIRPEIEELASNEEDLEPHVVPYTAKDSIVA